MSDEQPALDCPPPRWPMFWRVILQVQVLASAWWLWNMPGGFPLWHPRTWANRGLPAVVLVVTAIAWWSLYTGKNSRAVPLLWAQPFYWTAALVTGTFLFPISALRVLWLALPAVAVLWIITFVTLPRTWPARMASPKLLIALVAILAMLAGASAPVTQRAPTADTRPWNGELPEQQPAAGEPAWTANFELTPEAKLYPHAGSILVQCGTLRIELRPLLNFVSCSPDRCWTSLVNAARREGPVANYKSMDFRDEVLTVRYSGGIDHVLQARAEDKLVLTAFSRLHAPIYSHLNTFCELRISGHQRLALAFSPCPEERVTVEPFNYPIGRPVRCAFVDAQGQFHVAEARSGEKGPFRELAAGVLDNGALSILLYDNDQLAARLTFDDWAAQVGTQLSPTAGWGLPVNAIEFRRDGDALTADVDIFLTLAGTSLGRGWDSVGHNAGVYRNRVTIETIAPPKE